MERLVMVMRITQSMVADTKSLVSVLNTLAQMIEDSRHTHVTDVIGPKPGRGHLPHTPIDFGTFFATIDETGGKHDVG